jgi:hypothetical protein
MDIHEIIRRARRAQAEHDKRVDVQLSLDDYIERATEKPAERLWATEAEYLAFWRSDAYAPSQSRTEGVIRLPRTVGGYSVHWKHLDKRNDIR